MGLCARDVSLADAQGTCGREVRLGLQHGGPRMAVVCSVGHRKPFKCLSWGDLWVGAMDLMVTLYIGQWGE